MRRIAAATALLALLLFCPFAALGDSSPAFAATSPFAARVRTVYRGAGTDSLRSLIVYALDDPRGIRTREYPESAFPFSLKEYSDPPRLYVHGSHLLVLAMPKGETVVPKKLYAFSMDARLGLHPLGSVDQFPWEDIGGQLSVRGGEGGPRSPVQFEGDDLILLGREAIHVEGRPGNVITEVDSYARYRFGAEGLSLVESRLANDRRLALTPSVGEVWRFAGSEFGLWEYLALHGHDWSAALLPARRLEDHLGARYPWDAERNRRNLPSIALVGTSLALQTELDGAFYDLETDDFVESHAAALYFKGQSLWVGPGLLVTPSQKGGTELWDCSDPLHPSLLAEHAEIPAMDGSRLPFIVRSGDILSLGREDGFVDRYSLEPDRLLERLHTREELFAAIDAGDLDGLGLLLAGDLDPLAGPEGQTGREESAFDHALRAGSVAALRAIAAAEKTTGRGFSRAGSEAFQNPVIAAVQARNVEAAKALLDVFPEFAKTASESWRGSGATPLETAVRLGDRTMAALLIDRGAPLSATSFSYRGPRNLLSAAADEDMKSFLRARGVPSVIELQPPVAGIAREDANRLRAGPSLDAAVLGKTMRGDRVTVLALSAEEFQIDGQRAPWYRVRTASGLVGWTFGAYYSVSAWEGD